MNKIIPQKNEVFSENLENETMIFDPKKQMFYKLNKTGSFLWNLIDGKNSVNQIILNFSSKYKAKDAENDVKAMIRDLDHNGLIKLGK